jgi:hypothetical protein
MYSQKHSYLKGINADIELQVYSMMCFDLITLNLYFFPVCPGQKNGLPSLILPWI